MAQWSDLPHFEPHLAGLVLTFKVFFFLSIAVNPLLSDTAPHLEHEIAPNDSISSVLLNSKSPIYSLPSFQNWSKLPFKENASKFTKADSDSLRTTFNGSASLSDLPSPLKNHLASYKIQLSHSF